MSTETYDDQFIQKLYGRLLKRAEERGISTHNFELKEDYYHVPEMPLTANYWSYYLYCCCLCNSDPVKTCPYYNIKKGGTTFKFPGILLKPNIDRLKFNPLISICYYKKYSNSEKAETEIYPFSIENAKDYSGLPFSQYIIKNNDICLKYSESCERMDTSESIKHLKNTKLYGNKSIENIILDQYEEFYNTIIREYNEDDSVDYNIFSKTMEYSVPEDVPIETQPAPIYD